MRTEEIYHDNERVFLLDIGGSSVAANRGCPTLPAAPDLFTRHQRDRLIREKESITVDHQNLESEHMADILDQVARTQEEFIEATLRASQLQRLSEIGIALEAIEAGDYGTCENCCKEIPQAGLSAVPWARMCRKCQESSK